MANQIELFAIDNPCVGVCQSNKAGYCFGCLRSRQERQVWFNLDASEQRHILKLIAARRKRIEQMRRKNKEQLSLDFLADDAQLDFFSDSNLL